MSRIHKYFRRVERRSPWDKVVDSANNAAKNSLNWRETAFV